MSKKVDTNGYWYIKHNPISKEGVFPYLGHTISDECEPNKIYKVYRPAKTLEDSVETWDNPPKPFIDDHEMLGEGFTAIDDRPVQGIIYNPEYKNGTLYADIAVYSEDLKQNIENGKKELSLGYFCKYKKERGVFKGEVYDYVQYDMVGNHIALVDAGRCGSDVKVFDSKCTMDSLDIGGEFEKPLKKTTENGTIEIEQGKDAKMADKREYIRKIMAIAAKPDSDFDGGETEKIETIAKLLENSEYAKSEDEAEKEEEKKSEDKCGKDEEEKEEKKDTEDESEEEEKKKTEDSIKELMSVVKDMADDIKKLVARDEDDDDKEEKESEDGDDSEKESEDKDEEEKKESEDEDEEETKKSEDSAVFVFGANSAIAEDAALKEYLK